MAEPESERMDEPPNAELIAYLDGEMGLESARQFEKRLRNEPTLRAEMEAYKRTWELLDFLAQPEPSPTFTSKTLDKISVLRPANTGTLTLPAAAAAPPVAPQTSHRREPSWRGYLAGAAAAAVLFAVGYVLTGPAMRKEPPAVDPVVAEEEMARDLRILQNLRQYELADDMAFLQALDRPDLFGDDGNTR